MESNSATPPAFVHEQTSANHDIKVTERTASRKGGVSTALSLRDNTLPVPMTARRRPLRVDE